MNTDISLCSNVQGLESCKDCLRNPEKTKPAKMQYYLTPQFKINTTGVIECLHYIYYRTNLRIQ